MMLYSNYVLHRYIALSQPTPTSLMVSLIKPCLNFLWVISFAFLLYLFLFADIQQQDLLAIPCLLFATWCLLFSALIGLYNHQPIALDSAKTSWLKVMVSRMKKALFTLALVVFVLISSALFYASLKLLTFWFGI